MSRQARILSESGYYHVILRGVNRQDIFEEDEDMQRFLDTTFRFSNETEDKIVAWCLMQNHVHFLILSKSSPDKFAQKLGDSYVIYYNRKYARIGPLFQDRYKSEPIDDESYLLASVRYIHMNPEKAGICKMEEYRWSSYSDYIRGGGQTETAEILGMFANKEDFVRFMHTADGAEYLEEKHRLTENEAIALAKEMLPQNLFYLQHCDKRVRNDLVLALAERGLIAAQICRITGLERNIVYNILKN